MKAKFLMKAKFFMKTKFLWKLNVCKKLSFEKNCKITAPGCRMDPNCGECTECNGRPWRPILQGSPLGK